MSVARTTVTAEAKQVAQDPGGGAKLLLADPDYDLAIDQALETFKTDRPNLRIFHYTVPSAAFRFVLSGAGTILPTSGLDQWIDGGSRLEDVFHPFDITSQDNDPLDRNHWFVQREPSALVVLKLLSLTPSSGVLRLEYVRPHVIHATDIAQSSILAGDVKAFIVLDAVKLCEMTARRYVQNTGTSTFQNETIDRRTQSDIMASRAKELMKAYNALVGKGDAGEIPGAHVIKKFEIATRHGRGRLWHV